MFPGPNPGKKGRKYCAKFCAVLSVFLARCNSGFCTTYSSDRTPAEVVPGADDARVVCPWHYFCWSPVREPLLAALAGWRASRGCDCVGSSHQNNPDARSGMIGGQGAFPIKFVGFRGLTSCGGQANRLRVTASVVDGVGENNRATRTVGRDMEGRGIGLGKLRAARLAGDCWAGHNVHG